MVLGATAPHLFDFSEGYAEGETTHPSRAAAKKHLKYREPDSRLHVG
jgi:hypothetical protein